MLKQSKTTFTEMGARTSYVLPQNFISKIRPLCSEDVCSKVACDDGSRFLDCKTTTTAKENVFEAETFKSFIHVKFTGRL